MDEIWFRLSSQLELLQVHTSAMAQETQIFLSDGVSQAKVLMNNMCNEPYAQQVKEFGIKIFELLQKGIEQLKSHMTIRINMHQLHSQIIHFTDDLTKREVTFFISGIVVGTLIGYHLGYNSNAIPRHVQQIKSIICHRYIGPEGVSMIEEAEMPTIKRSNELLIQVIAASLHDVDIKICTGYSKTYRKLLNSTGHNDLPIQLGRDCAGFVIDIGRGVVSFDVGDEVYLAVPSWAPGTMAEYIVVPENMVWRRPKLVSFEAAASLPYSGCLAWDALVNRTVIEEGNAMGRRVLVCGGNTPIGCILIQLIKIWGGHVVTTCRPNAVTLLQALGADHVIAVGESNIEKELELLDRYDVIFYTGGVPIQHRMLKQHLMPHGSFISTVPENLTSDTLGFVFGSIFAGCVRVKLMFQSIFGISTQHWREGSKLKTAYLRGIQELVDSDMMQVVVDRVYAPHCIDLAIQHLHDPDAVGSTVIKFK